MRRRTPFVWLADQRIDHQAGFATLRGAPLRREEGVNRWVLARGRFTLPPDHQGAELAVTVDGRYRLWLNGAHVGRGPTRATPQYQRFDSYKIEGEPGDNVLAVIVHVPGADLAWYETMKGGWQPVFGDGGLYVEATAGGEPVPIAWRMFESEAWRRDTARSGWGQDFIEDFDARLLDPEWIEPDFDDGGWPEARDMVSLGDAAQTARGFGRVEPFPALLPSDIPHPVETELGPSELLWVRATAPGDGKEPDRRLYSDRILGEADSFVTNAAALLSDEGETVVSTDEDRGTAIMLAFNPYHAGRPFIEFDASGGEIVEIAVGEAIPGEFGRGVAGDGLRQEGHLDVAHLMRCTARPGRQRFEKFNWAGVRVMQVIVRNAPDGIVIRRVGSLATHYPANPEGAFECSDPLLNRLWAVGRHTVLQCMHDSWIDCPGRETRQWVGDAVVQFDVAALAFGPSIYPLQKQFLHHAAESQRADGLIRMFAPGDIAPDALVIPDFTLLWILALQRYYLQSGDLETVDAILPAIERALAWFERHCDRAGLLADVPHWHFIEWANLGRAGEAAAVNALYVGALDATVALANVAGRARLAERCKALREKAAAALNARHWDAERQVYVDSVDPESKARGRRVSQHANALMLLFDIAPAERRGAMLAAITDRARLKLTAAPPIVPDEQPFDEAVDIVRANSFFSHFVYSGIAAAGGFDWVMRDISDNYGPMLATGTTTLWESFTPNASLCHGFSATPVYQLSLHCLGVAPAKPGYASFTIAPEPGLLKWAKGTVTTPHGPIAVDWRLENDELMLDVTYPDVCEMIVAEGPDRRLLSSEAIASGRRLRFALAGTS